MDQTTAVSQTSGFYIADVRAMPHPLSPEHIHPHKLWACMCTETELNPLEQSHIRDCETCMETMRLCLHAPTFGAVLRELQKLAED